MNTQPNQHNPSPTKDSRIEAIEQMERELAQPLQHFRAAITAVAEREMARAEQKAPMRVPERMSWFQSRLVMGLAPALLLLLLTVGLIMAGYNDHRPAPAGNQAPAQTEAVATPQQVSDSALFTEIDEDLTQTAPQSMAPLEGTTTTNKTTHENTTQVEEINGVEK